jgi:hypothetical protein
MSEKRVGFDPLPAMVRKLFDRLDRRDLSGFLRCFEPGAEIVHDDGAATDPKRLAGSLSSPPIRRTLAGFRGEAGRELGWVAYENEVTFRLDDGTPKTFRFSETALLRKRTAGWRFVRVHYSGDRR